MRPAPSAHDPEGIAELRDALAEVGYTAEAVRELLATEVTASRDSAELPLYLRLLPEGEPLSTLVKLFLLDVPVAREEAAAAIAPLSLDRAVGLGILEPEGAGVAPAVEIVPADDLLIACDPFRDELAHPDHVLGISSSARVLAALTVRLPVESALDVGAGNGYQAILGAQHARRVVAVDVNPRALRFAAFNAALNEVENVELRAGSLFEPVDETFDLVVCNPPYAVSPGSELAYRDNPLPGDAFCEGIVRQVPEFLEEGGFGHVLVSWVHGRDEDWSERVRGWVEGSGCDAVVLHYATHEPLEYAAGWNGPLRSEPAAYADALDRWSGYYHRLGIEAISWGAIVLRRRRGPSWVWCHSPSSQRITRAGDHVLSLFAAQDYLTEAGDDGALLDGVFALDERHTLEQSVRLEEGMGVIGRSVLRLDAGLRPEVSVDAATVGVLALLDGQRPLREVLVEAARDAPDGPSPEAFSSAALPAVRRLLELGYLVHV